MTDRMQDDYVHVDTHARLVAEAVAAAVQLVLDDVGYTYDQLGERARAAIPDPAIREDSEKKE